MNTASHLVLTAAVRKAWRRTPIVTGAFLLGAVAPDLPLLALSIGGDLYYRAVLGWSRSTTFVQLFGNLYFHDPFWIVAHNLLHAPLVLAGGLAVAGVARRRWPAAAAWLWWFLIACLLHAGIDVFTHHDDGPLLLFPFNWSYRFQSPVSYWDTRHYGFQFALCELTLDAALLVYLAVPWLRRRLAPLPRRDAVPEA